MKKLMAFILTVCMLLSMTAFAPLESFATVGTWGGSGTAVVPYVISDKADLLLLATNVANGTNYMGNYFVLGNDIDLSSDATAWTPIGYRFSTLDSSKFFSGSFDGNYHSVKNLNYTNTTLNNSTTSAIGGALFGAVDGATIKNLTVASGTVTGSKWVSGICGYAANATISNCINKASTTYIGTAANQSGQHVGGIVGELNIASTVSDCKNYGSIRGGNMNVGGIVGDISAGGCIISSCINTGSVYGYGQGTNSVYQLGGICGQAANTGNINAISECYNTGNLTSNKTQTDSGGIMGKAFKTIVSDCYNTGNVGSGSGVSGITASGGATNTTGCVYNCVNYSTGNYAISNIPAARCVNNYYDASKAYSNTNGGTAASATDLQGTTGTLVTSLNAGTHATDVVDPWVQGTNYPILKCFDPAAKDISIVGKNLVGETLQGSYGTYSDGIDNIESGSTATWRKADDSAFTSNVEVIKTEQISAKHISTYTLTNQDVGKYIQFSVIPRNQAAERNVGAEASVILNGQVRIPQTVPSVNLLTPKDGAQIATGKDIKMTVTAECDNTTITKVEYYANNSKCAESTAAPFSSTWSGAGTGNYQVFARAYNALGESGDSSVVNISVLSVLPTVWAGKWGYDFNQFTDGTVYTSATPLTLSGTLPPKISISSSGTAQSAHGLFGKAADDYSLKVNSIAGAGTTASLSLDLSQLDEPVENLVAQMDVAFSTTDETRNIFTCKTPDTTYNPISFTSDGKIKYSDGTSQFSFKDGNEQDLTYEANRWYHVAAKYDFVNQKSTYYIDGNELCTAEDILPSSATDIISTMELTVSGTHNASQTGAFYMDNLFLGQEQASYVTSVLTSPVEGASFLKGTAVTFTGYAKDARNKEITKIELYANDDLIAEKTGSTYNFTLSDLPTGEFDIVAKAINEDGEEGFSKPAHIGVDGIALPKMYADGMLLQRNKPISIAGKGFDDVTVTAELNGASASTVVAGGKFNLTLPPQPANKGTTLTIRTSEGVTKVFQNVAIGELIMCSGQSNMQYALNKFWSLKSEADKDYPDIRLFVQNEPSSGTIKDDIPTGLWKPATVSASLNFSAVGFLTGKNYYLSQNGQVPVGLIHASVGGTVIKSWVTPTSYDNDPDLASMKSGMSDLYKPIVAPWTNYTIGSVIWYQGESDTMLTLPYEKMLTAYIKGWRNAWKDDSINFVIIQLTNYNYLQKYKYARSLVGVREAEWNVSQTFDHVATVVATDCGEEWGVHPQDKKPLAQRASLALQHFTNLSDTTLVWKSPSLDHFVQQGNQMTLYFKDIAGGLKTKDGLAPKGFKIAGDDGVFKDTAVTLVNNTIVVDTSSVVGTPKVRYAFEDCPAMVNSLPTANFVNSADLPVAPFRTDHERINFKSLDTTTFTLYNPVNFTPCILNIKAGPVIGQKSTITVEAKDYDDDVAKVDVYADSVLLGTATRAGTSNLFTYQWVNPTLGVHSLHAIATDTAGATSVKMDPSLGTTSISPQKFNVTLSDVIPEQYTILPLEDLSGKAITFFDGENGVTAKAVVSSGNAVLLMAAYNGNKLVNLKIAENNSVSFSTDDLLQATKVKAFLFKDLTTNMPLAIPGEILRDKNN